ncbi:MAG: hypothetical protein K2G23_08745 [Muribaculaceae bacterium]|nr:hypothetical protein [Muribaculaceae bacterium]
MERNEIKPWRRVLDMTLIILCWFTVSPLMWLVNRDKAYLKKKAMVWLTIFSPFTWGILALLFLLVGIPVLANLFPSFALKVNSFPEFTGSLDGSGGFWQTLLTIYFLPVYSFCVLALFISMAFTGWSYVTASVYICEYFQPWFCIGVAGVVILRVAYHLGKMNILGQCLSVILVLLELTMIYFNFSMFMFRVISYGDMNNRQIFDVVVKMLIALGEETHTNYITANIIVYILPLVAILLIGYIGWIIYTVNKKDKTA